MTGGQHFPEPDQSGSRVIGRMNSDSHHAATDREWVRVNDWAPAPWVSVSDQGNLIAMRWQHLIVEQIVASRDSNLGDTMTTNSNTPTITYGVATTANLDGITDKRWIVIRTNTETTINRGLAVLDDELLANAVVDALEREMITEDKVSQFIDTWRSLKGSTKAKWHNTMTELNMSLGRHRDMLNKLESTDEKDIRRDIRRANALVDGLLEREKSANHGLLVVSLATSGAIVLGVINLLVP